jgi:hypothetical protein
MPGAGPPPCTTASRNRRGPRGGLLHRHQNAERVAEAAAAQPHRPVEVLSLDPLADGAGLPDAVQQRRVDHLVPADADKLGGRAGSIGQQPLDRRVPEQRPQIPVKGAGSTSALNVAQDRDPGVLAEALLQQPLDLADRDPLAVAVLRPFGDQHHVLPAALVASGPQDRAHQGGPVVPLRRTLRDEDPVCAGRQRPHQREIAAVPAHDLNDEGPLMTGRGAVDGIQRFGDPVQRRVGADRHVGAEHVVVDRADQPHEPQERVSGGHLGVHLASVHQLRQQLRPLLAEQVRAGQAAVTTDHDQRVDAELQQVARCPPATVPLQKL